MSGSIKWPDRDGPRIQRLPEPIKPIARLVKPGVTLVRKALRKMAGGALLSDYNHRSDRMATKSIVGFLDDGRFQTAYARAVKAGGWDYGLPYRVHQAIWCSRMARRVPGDFVELGTGRGFIMSAILADIEDWNEAGRSAFLFDTFEDGWVINSGRGEPSPYYAESYEKVVENFREWQRVHLVRGNVFETLANADIDQIAFLHVDLNAHEPEVWAIEHLWDRISPGGIILLDDFANVGHDEQNAAILRLSEKLGFDPLYTASGQGIVIR